MKKTPGMVYLVGAGPGDPGLLTLRAAELLGRADVVVYDALVSTETMRLASPQAEKIYAGKRSAQHAIPQEDLNKLLVAKAREGKTVVRLKGGDPYVFGRGGEEALELAEAGIAFEVVPGISSVVAGPNYAGIPITHRDFCSSFTVLTGHEDPTKPGSALDYATLAKLAGTKIVLMGVDRIRSIAAELVRHGQDAATAVAMVRWATTGRQETLVGTLGTIADRVEETGFSAPALTVIGGVVELRSKLDWFERRKLFGRRIVVTRTREQASQLSADLRELGAEVMEIPTIKIVPPKDLKVLVEVIGALGEYDWVVFTSPNGVTAFFDYFLKAYQDIRDLGALHFAAVGPATAAKLNEHHLFVDAVPDKYLASEVAGAISKVTSIENLRILLLRAEVANEELPRLLEEKGAIVDDVACYRTILETEDADGSAARLREVGAEWVTFTSSSTVENFHARFNLPELLRQWPDMKTASIGPETTKALASIGITPTVEAAHHNLSGLVQALLRWESGHRPG